MYSEDDLLPLSGLQHFAFCERRWALVHIESIWLENRFTAEGRLLHERAHAGGVESRPGVLIRRTIPVRSLKLGVTGQADVIEFYPVAAEEPGARLPHQNGLWRPYPIEYKRSRDKAGSVAYRVQLCAQAICLEEMLNTVVPEGAVYDRASRRRQSVAFDELLREEVERVAARMRELYVARFTPKARYEKKCDHCSLYSVCLPKTTGAASAQKYLKKSVATAISSSGDEQ